MPYRPKLSYCHHSGFGGSKNGETRREKIEGGATHYTDTLSTKQLPKKTETKQEGEEKEQKETKTEGKKETKNATVSLTHTHTPHSHATDPHATHTPLPLSKHTASRLRTVGEERCVGCGDGAVRLDKRGLELLQLVHGPNTHAVVPRRKRLGLWHKRRLNVAQLPGLKGVEGARVRSQRILVLTEAR